jgi:HEPN domain-containing protein
VGTGPDWLVRLTSGDWMRAALLELERAYQALDGKRYREGLAHARRAAGMGVNAQFRLAIDRSSVQVPADYGRSFVAHLLGLAEDPAVPEGVREAARRLHDAPARQELVPLGRGSVTLADDARTILVHVADGLPDDVK